MSQPYSELVAQDIDEIREVRNALSKMTRQIGLLDGRRPGTVRHLINGVKRTISPYIVLSAARGDVDSTPYKTMTFLAAKVADNGHPFSRLTVVEGRFKVDQGLHSTEMKSFEELGLVPQERDTLRVFEALTELAQEAQVIVDNLEDVFTECANRARRLAKLSWAKHLKAENPLRSLYEQTMPASEIDHALNRAEPLKPDIAEYGNDLRNPRVVMGSYAGVPEFVSTETNERFMYCAKGAVVMSVISSDGRRVDVTSSHPAMYSGVQITTRNGNEREIWMKPHQGTNNAQLLDLIALENLGKSNPEKKYLVSHVAAREYMLAGKNTPVAELTTKSAQELQRLGAQLTDQLRGIVTPLKEIRNEPGLS